MKKLSAPLFAITVAVLSSCSAVESKNAGAVNASVNTAVSGAAANSISAGPRIEITEGGPADTVRAFYDRLRNKKFREAIFMTNLRPAVEGLTDTELQDFSVDFEQLAGQVPAQVEINGEIITGDKATVTLNMPNVETGKPELQPIKLHKENGVWIIESVDPAAEARIRKEGNRYLYNVRIETHEDEARAMLDRIAKAQMVQSAQNGGQYSDIAALIAGGLLPEDARTSASTGYSYNVGLSADKKSYFATATPADYGKSGRLSFLVELDSKAASHLTSKDTGGKPLKQ